MAKRVFFCFHYEDVKDFRANVVRNHWLTKQDRDASGFFDASIWESARKQGRIGLKRLINDALERTSATCVLIGIKTHSRPWVRYEIFKSLERGNKLLGIYINRIPDKNGKKRMLRGRSPFDRLAIRILPRSTNAIPLIRTENADGSISLTRFSLIDKLDIAAYSHLFDKNLRVYRLKDYFPVYDWVLDDGYNNFHKWVQ